jgi:hypothetical protein
MVSDHSGIAFAACLLKEINAQHYSIHWKRSTVIRCDDDAPGKGDGFSAIASHSKVVLMEPARRAEGFFHCCWEKPKGIIVRRWCALHPTMIHILVIFWELATLASAAKLAH